MRIRIKKMKVWREVNCLLPLSRTNPHAEKRHIQNDTAEFRNMRLVRDEAHADASKPGPAKSTCRRVVCK
ncbi:hypothetical protein Mapa_013726 [Marchantia paleacea]|nr:hypothetical protein Mapa_013726 [Marchantia paleacea]